MSLEDEVMNLFKAAKGYIANEYKTSNEAFKNLQAHQSIYQRSKNIKSDVARDINPPAVIKGWINCLEDQLKDRVASPMNKAWFKKAYHFAGFDGCGPTCHEIANSNCPGCEDPLHIDGPITINMHESCQFKLVEMFRKASENALITKEFNDARFILSGFAGEGKTAWLNNFYSVYQDTLYEKRVFIDFCINNAIMDIHGGYSLCDHPVPLT
jgi:hypothetical protein